MSKVKTICVPRARPGVARLNEKGVTLVELIMAVLIFAIVLAVLNGVFFSSNRLYGTTAVRAGQQMNARVGLSVMVTELRTAGCDPGLQGVANMLSATGDSAHVLADYDGDGAIETVEPSETVLLLRRQPDGGYSGPWYRFQAMIRNVTAFTFTYFNANNQVMACPSRPQTWTSSARSVSR